MNEMKRLGWWDGRWTNPFVWVNMRFGHGIAESCVKGGDRAGSELAFHQSANFGPVLCGDEAPVGEVHITVSAFGWEEG